MKDEIIIKVIVGSSWIGSPGLVASTQLASLVDGYLCGPRGSPLLVSSSTLVSEAKRNRKISIARRGSPSRKISDGLPRRDPRVYDPLIWQEKTKPSLRRRMSFACFLHSSGKLNSSRKFIKILIRTSSTNWNR